KRNSSRGEVGSQYPTLGFTYTDLQRYKNEAYLILGTPHSHYWIILRLVERINLNLRRLSLPIPDQLYRSVLSDALGFRLFQQFSYCQQSYDPDVFSHLHSLDDLDLLVVYNDFQIHKQRY